MSEIKRIERERQALLRDLEIGEKEMLAGDVPQSRIDELQAKAKEVEQYQAQIEQYNRVAGIVRDSRKIDAPHLPGENGRPQSKLVTSPGHIFAYSDPVRQYKAVSKQGWSAWVDIKNARGKRVVLTGDEADAFRVKSVQGAFDVNDLPDFGDGVIEPHRDPDLVRFEEPDILTIRDVMSVTPVTTDAVRFTKFEITRAAASQMLADSNPATARGGLKPYLTVEAAVVTTQVETIAVLSKVSEQDIDDAPRLVAVINNEMRMDVRAEEERQLIWGDGAARNLEGLFEQGVEDYEFDRAAQGDTIIDTLRRMQTDLRKRRVFGQSSPVATAALIDPIDWEDVELQKSTSDEHYIWAVVRDRQGPRIWSMRVIESDAMTNPTTGERRIVVGDFRRGATLYDRHDVRLAVGFVDDDFARNLRTLRAEERLALGVKRPWAFTWAQTEVGSS